MRCCARGEIPLEDAYTCVVVRLLGCACDPSGIPGASWRLEGGSIYRAGAPVYFENPSSIVLWAWLFVARCTRWLQPFMLSIQHTRTRKQLHNGILLLTICFAKIETLLFKWSLNIMKRSLYFDYDTNTSSIAIQTRVSI